MAYEITEENRRRLELMKAFGVIEGKEVTFQHLINMAIERLFTSASMWQPPLMVPVSVTK